ncbi:MAG: thiamine biosynthesis protein ThiF [Cryomorphaceae bacterium]|nr:MAG: thiamine biosynthesis protein ThiF [Cryomorphaceae bacterium]
MNSNERYTRQMALPRWGEEGQQRLRSAHIAVVGAGGLGCPALQYLAAAGVGRITVVDFDRIDVSNLNRQILFSPADVGKHKAETACKKLRLLNPEVELIAVNEPFTAELAAGLLPHCDLLLDCTDRLHARYAISDACVRYNKPHIHAGVYRNEGQLAVLNWRGGATYRCIFPAHPSSEHTTSCEEAGVMGTIPGMLGVLQAHEAIRALIWPHEVKGNELRLINLQNNTMRNIETARSMSYGSDAAPVREISADELITQLEQGKTFTFVDVREPFESPSPALWNALNIPMSSWVPEEVATRVSALKDCIIFCQHGVRSIAAIASLPLEIQANITNLTGGLAAFKIAEANKIAQ